MSFVHRTSPGAFVRERRAVLVSVMGDRREGPLLRISVAAALAASLGWSVRDRLSPGMGSGDDAGWLELAPAERGPILRSARGSRLVWFASGAALVALSLGATSGVPARHDVAAAVYVRPAANRQALRILLPWWRSDCANRSTDAAAKSGAYTDMAVVQ